MTTTTPTRARDDSTWSPDVRSEQIVATYELFLPRFAEARRIDSQAYDARYEQWRSITTTPEPPRSSMMLGGAGMIIMMVLGGGLATYAIFGGRSTMHLLHPAIALIMVGFLLLMIDAWMEWRHDTAVRPMLLAERNRLHAELLHDFQTDRPNAFGRDPLIYQPAQDAMDDYYQHRSDHIEGWLVWYNVRANHFATPHMNAVCDDLRRALESFKES